MSFARRPRVVRTSAIGITINSTIARTMNGQYEETKFVNEINIRVGSGSVAWNPSKNVLNLGSTKVDRTIDRRRSP